MKDDVTPPQAPAGGFKVGGRHRLRNAQIVTIICVNRPKNPNYPIVWMSDWGDIEVCCANGALTYGATPQNGRYSLLDIVGGVLGRPPKQNPADSFPDVKDRPYRKRKG